MAWRRSKRTDFVFLTPNILVWDSEQQGSLITAIVVNNSMRSLSLRYTYQIMLQTFIILFFGCHPPNHHHHHYILNWHFTSPDLFNQAQISQITATTTEQNHRHTIEDWIYKSVENIKIPDKNIKSNLKIKRKEWGKWKNHENERRIKLKCQLFPPL